MNEIPAVLQSKGNIVRVQCIGYLVPWWLDTACSGVRFLACGLKNPVSQ